MWCQIRTENKQMVFNRTEKECAVSPGRQNIIHHALYWLIFRLVLVLL